MALNVSVNNKNYTNRVRGKIKHMIFCSKCSFKFSNYSTSFTFIAKFCFITCNFRWKYHEAFFSNRKIFSHFFSNQMKKQPVFGKRKHAFSENSKNGNRNYVRNWGSWITRLSIISEALIKTKNLCLSFCAFK